MASHNDTSDVDLARIAFDDSNRLAAEGKEDAAHERLLEAHRLNRKSLVITLALGQSCFQRKLWRESSRYLGSLAEHPEAREHAAEVANGLVMAGQAAVRALRPNDALKFYESAIGLDENCGAAWHALAQIAIERGDTARAAECLEREASTTSDPAAKDRLLDALGDFAIGVIHDEGLAERCWIQIREPTPAILDKLLLLQRQHIGHLERGETCQKLAALDPSRHRELLIEATDAFAAGEDFVRARKTAEQLMASYPLDVEAVTSATAVTLAACDAETTSLWLKRALQAWKTAGDRDERHAELWRRLGDAEQSRDRRGDAKLAYKRAIDAAPESQAALYARRGLVTLGAMSGRVTGNSLRALVEAEQAPTDIISLAQLLAGSNQTEEARAMYELAIALGVELTGSDLEIFNANTPRPLADDEAYSAALDDTERRALVDDKGDSPFDELFDMLGEAVGVANVPDPNTALTLSGMGDATRLSTTSYGTVATMYPQISKALGGPLTLLYASEVVAEDVQVLLAKPPVVVFGGQLVQLKSARGMAENEADVRFAIGRVIELARPRRIFAAGTSASAFRLLVQGLFQAFGKPADDVDDAVANEAERLRTKLPMLIRRRLTDLLATIDRAALDPDAYLAACARAADRSGLLACCNTIEAIRLAGGPEAAPHLVRFAASAKYLEARRKLRAPRRDSRPVL